MSTTSPFSFLQSLAHRFPPPAWLVDEGQQRIVLLLNHVLMQEQQAQDRLARKKGSVVHVRWGLFALDLQVTPAGLLDRAPAGSRSDLLVSLAGESPLAVLQSFMGGKPPPVKIEGDVQLAAELGWLAENLRWDVEEDLSRVVGDAPAHALAEGARRLQAAVRQFVSRQPGANGAAATAGTAGGPGAGVASADAASVSSAYVAPGTATVPGFPLPASDSGKAAP
jgi:ubiquinone biosynthesis accessory factor UbiJ